MTVKDVSEEVLEPYGQLRKWGCFLRIQEPYDATEEEIGAIKQGL